MPSRLVPFIALACLVFVPSAARPDDAKATKTAAPALVVRVRSVDSLIADFSYLGAQVGKEEEAKQAVELLKERTGNKGLDGIDVKKPLGGYVIAGPNGTDSYGAFMLPIKDEKTILDILANNNIKADKGKDGLYTVKDPRLKAPVFFRFANGYAYVTALNAAGVATDKLLAPADILPEKETALVTATIRIDQIPDSIKEVGLGWLSLTAAQIREDKFEGTTQAQKDLTEQASKESMAQIKSLVNDGSELTIRVDMDRQKNDLALSFSLNGKPGSKLATSIAELGKHTSLFAGLISKDSAASFLLTYALPERVRKALGPAIDEGVVAAADRVPDETHKAMSQKLLKALTPSLKAGEIDAAADFRGPSKDKHYTLVAGVKLKDGQAVEQTVKELVKDLPEQVRDLVKIDAQKAGNVNIHSVEIDRVIDDKARDVFGNEPLHFAVRSNALFLAAGEGGLAALKQALDAKAGQAELVRLDMAVARLAPLMARDQPAAPQAAKDAFKNPGDDRISVRVSGGDTLKTEIHAKVAVLKFLALIGEAKQTSRK
jgi:hypothetical protein